MKLYEEWVEQEGPMSEQAKHLGARCFNQVLFDGPGRAVDSGRAGGHTRGMWEARSRRCRWLVAGGAFTAYCVYVYRQRQFCITVTVSVHVALVNNFCEF